MMKLMLSRIAKNLIRFDSDSLVTFLPEVRFDSDSELFWIWRKKSRNLPLQLALSSRSDFFNIPYHTMH